MYSHLAVCNAKVRNSPIGMQEGKTPAFYVMFNHSTFPGHIQKSKCWKWGCSRLYSTAVTDSITRIAQVAKFSLFQFKTQLNSAEGSRWCSLPSTPLPMGPCGLVVMCKSVWPVIERFWVHAAWSWFFSCVCEGGGGLFSLLWHFTHSSMCACRYTVAS